MHRERFMPVLPKQISLPRGRAWCEASLHDLEALLAEAESPRAVMLKRDRRSEVVRVEHGGRLWVVKRYRLPRWKQALYQALRLSPAWRELRGAAMLMRHGLPVGRPAALVQLRGLRGAPGEVLVHHWVEGVTLGSVLRSAMPRDQRLELAAALGRQAGRITAAGLVNRDHKPANIIVNVRGDGIASDEPVVIDALGIRRRSGRDDPAVWRMVELLWRCVGQIATVRPREVVTFIRAMIEADPTLGPRRREVTAAVKRVAKR